MFEFITIVIVVVFIIFKKKRLFDYKLKEKKEVFSFAFFYSILLIGFLYLKK